MVIKRIENYERREFLGEISMHFRVDSWRGFSRGLEPLLECKKKAKRVLGSRTHTKLEF